MKQLNKEQEQHLQWLLLLAGGFTTLTIWTSLGDPINVPKLFILSIFSAWILGIVLTTGTHSGGRKLSLGQWSLVAFVLGIIISAIFTDVHYAAFFGAPLRNTGAIAYISLGVLSFAAMMIFDSSNVWRLRNAVLIVGAILIPYGLLQALGKDPLHWVLVYGPVIGTLGNPDFMSALGGVVALATLWFVLGQISMRSRILGICALLIEIFVIRKSGSIQGMITFLSGAALIVLIVVGQKSRRIGIAAWALSAVMSIPIVMGLLNSGPFASFLYRSSLKNRLDYWQAAVSMFKAHPFAGVGLERFFESYGKYAPQIQVVQGQSTNNAHNVFLQLFATGGLIVGLPYLFLLGVIFYSGIKAIRASSGQAQIDIASLFSIWIALLFVSLVSIDNLGVAVWFWILGGAVYAVYKNQTIHDAIIASKKKDQRKPNKKVESGNSNYLGQIVSLILVVGMLVIMVPLGRTSAMIFDLQSNKSQLSSSQYLAKVDQVGRMWPQNAQTFAALADIALRIQNPPLALKYADAAIRTDAKSNFGYQLGALACEAEKKYVLAVPYRLRLMELDPWNTHNMLPLVQDYVYLKDLGHAREIAARISHLYPSSADATSAAALIKG